MEYVDGVSLDLLHRGPEPEYPVIRRIARDILAALAHLHDHDLMHRDVTPRNVLMSQEGTAKVTDLGLVKEQQGSISGCFCGTPAYASPEALQGRRYTPSSDLYSVATILYELLTNMKPNGAGRPDEVLESIYNDDRPPLAEDVPEDLAKLVDGLMAVDPIARTYRTAAEALDQLDGPLADDVQLAAIVAQSPRPEPDPNVPELGWPFSKHEPEPQPMSAPETPRIRSGWLTALVLSLALSLGTLGLGFGLGRTNSTTPATEAPTSSRETPSTEPPTPSQEAPSTLRDAISTDPGETDHNAELTRETHTRTSTRHKRHQSTHVEYYPLRR
jgi:serine/threonine protein kinase